MKCLNDICIYNKNNRCMFNKITIDEVGMRENCIFPTFNKKILNNAKSKTLMQSKTKY